MSQPVSDRNAPQPSSAARREAAVWIARIHSPDRTPRVEAGLRRWLAASPENEAAFERANEIWDVAAKVPESAVPRVMRWKRLLPTPPRTTRYIAVACSVVLVAIAIFYWRTLNSSIETGVGEQRSVTLNDGTRVSLNTATRIVLRYSDSDRRVELESGEAIFDVAKDPMRPFVVMAGSREIRALGTSFVVRYDADRMSVTLVDGEVLVGDGAGAPPLAPPVAQRDRPNRGGGSIKLMPGQRLVFTSKSEPQLDQPPVDTITAWQRGLVALDHTPLSDAVAEMNRYSSLKLEVATPEAAVAKISGVFRAGDSVYFAQAIAQTHRLKVEHESGRIVLSGVPR